jgi:hypothetical protein
VTSDEKGEGKREKGEGRREKGEEVTRKKELLGSGGFPIDRDRLEVSVSKEHRQKTEYRTLNT